MLDISNADVLNFRLCSDLKAKDRNFQKIDFEADERKVIIYFLMHFSLFFIPRSGDTVGFSNVVILSNFCDSGRFLAETTNNQKLLSRQTIRR